MSRYLPIRYHIMISIIRASGLFAHNCIPKDVKADTAEMHPFIPNFQKDMKLGQLKIKPIPHELA